MHSALNQFIDAHMLRPGDLIRLKQLFIPCAMASRGYRYGQVVNVICGNNVEPPSQVSEILVHLCESDRSFFYLDESRSKPLFCFYPEEIERVETLR